MENEKQLLQSLHKAVVKIKMLQSEYDDLKKQVDEPIAIIGMSCRLPGGANTPLQFWNLIKEGYDGISEVPADRWDIEEFYDPDPEVFGKMYVRKGGFLLHTDIKKFDARFFGISPREVELMDPQHRILLEVVWEALEDSYINPLTLRDSLTGVFIGVSTHDYETLLIGAEHSAENIYTMTGNTYSALSGRISYFLGLQGPSFAVDTACSSSLVSLNYACKSLRSRECNLALAGGVNLMLNPELTILCCKGRVLAADGYCKTFDESADGYVRGEGCGVLVLKRLSDATQDQDRILGIIRTSEVNQDGASSGWTVPNGEAQTALLRRALDNAHLEPDEIDYIEAHGTGTALGDPIEVKSIAAVYGGRKEGNLMIGSVKTNIGHLEAAAGVAAVIKTLLSLQNQALPPHLHFKHLNPHISLQNIPAKISTQLTPWPRSERPRLAGINSFALTGTNAHIILQEGPELEEKINNEDRPIHLLTFSAKSPEALENLRQLYLNLEPENKFADQAYCANTGRAHFLYRSVVIARSTQEFKQFLRDGKYLSGRANERPPKLTFVFTGSVNGNVDFCSAYPIFKQAMEKSHGLWEYALSELFKSWGIIPDYVAGEGSGDIIAAIVAEVITLEEGLKLIAVKDTPDKLMDVAKEISYRKPRLRFISSWTGEVIRKEGLVANYWTHHEQVRSIPNDSIEVEFKDNWEDLLLILSNLYLKGVDIDWKAFDKAYSRNKVILPTYPFQRELYWFELKSNLDSFMYHTSWQPLPLQIQEEPTVKSRIIVYSSLDQTSSSDSARQSQIEPLRSLEGKSVKPEDAAKEIEENPHLEIIWFVRGHQALKEILPFIRSIAKMKHKPAVYFITQGIQPLGSKIDLENSIFDGFFKTLILEIPDLKCRHIDIGFNEELIIDELHDKVKEQQVAYREGIRYVPRLKHIQKSIQETQIPIDPSASYLITGGFSGMGLKVAERLARLGAKNLILVGRRNPPAIQIENAAVTTLSVDISHKPSVKSLMLKFGTELPELKGIIHAAGLPAQGVYLKDLEWEEYETGMMAKVQGSWNLHEVSLDKPLDFFILFSSLSSILGFPRGGAYSSGNSYINALAYQRYLQNLPVLAISWGAWTNVGMAADVQIKSGRIGGQLPFKPELVIQLLERAFTKGYPHLTIVDMVWREYIYQVPFISELVAKETKTIKPTKQLFLMKELQNALPSERKKILVAYLQKTLSEILKTSSISPDLGFFEAGMDSLMAMEFKQHLQEELGEYYVLPATLAFDFPNISAVSEHLITVLFENDASKKEDEKIDHETEINKMIETEVANMSIEEVDKLLN